ncbi:MAG: ERF family protein, partial [Proteobacteria bacterium]|nr:ERF family protein [Pseudomonadota bacterium]
MTDQLIYKKMAEIITAVGSVSKDRTSVGKFSFKYRGIDDVMNALHQAFAEAGVFVQQELLKHTMSPIEGRGIHHIAQVRFMFTTTDGSYVSSIVYGECIENGDKGIGKCMSYALKTCLLQTFLIPTEDEYKDPDSTNQPILKSVSKAPKNASHETAGPTLAELKADA